MTNTSKRWYVYSVGTLKVAPFPGQEKVRGEIAIKKRFEASGVECVVPERIEFIRQGKRRFPDAIRSPYLSGYVFACLTDDQFIHAGSIDGLWSTAMPICKKEYERSVAPFFDEVDKELKIAEAIIEANDTVAMCQFKSGDALDVLSGAFSESLVRFKRIADDANRMFPVIIGEVDIFGKPSEVALDPMQVRLKA